MNTFIKGADGLFSYLEHCATGSKVKDFEQPELAHLPLCHGQLADAWIRDRLFEGVDSFVQLHFH